MTDTGGPAFPGPYANENGGIEVLWKQQGMTLRDWFAGKALMGMMASRNPNSPRFHPDVDSEYVYAVADAMLKERSK